MSQKQQTITQAVKEDHEEMYEYYDLYKKAAGDVDTQQRWARQLTWEIARHAVGEEIVVYPLMEAKLGAEGKKLTDQDRADHQIAKEKLALMETLKVGTDRYEQTITELMEHLRKHNTSEETEDLPMLEPKIGEEGSKHAAQSFKRTKKFVPTRAHPWAPNKPPYETLVSFIEMPIDKLKDLFSNFPTEEMKEEAKREMAYESQ
ncbi:hypothetical protein AX16_000778 [Volvariella volvacea WC 439]|nr:hypothetical protein AX16_000778 [Volvariella volvacea WC 439]